MRQSDLDEHESTGIQCPKGCGSYKNLSIHWGKMHDETLPSGLKRVTVETSKNLADSQRGKEHSKETREKLSQIHKERELSEAQKDALCGSRPPEHKKAISEGMEGRNLSEEHKDAISGSLAGRTLPKEWRETLSEAAEGRVLSEKTRQSISDSLAGRSLPKETKRKISESLKGRTFTKEHRENLSESLQQAHVEMEFSEDHLRAISTADTGPNGRMCVRATGHEVLNQWEMEIDLLLHKTGVVFEYEPDSFQIAPDRSYTPDFRVDDCIIEVRGHTWSDEATRAELFMDTHPDYEYIVVGTETPADVWIPWAERERLADIVPRDQ